MIDWSFDYTVAILIVVSVTLSALDVLGTTQAIAVLLITGSALLFWIAKYALRGYSDATQDPNE
ncbi:hypothetical protein [Natrialba aegyptia]|uniref:Uncharacterized protein n=1 Tax=Natrialba aegyptia DSM 13077 TaxID=1227491 RepID=M0BAS1_9EURY|nr:hypothetical protein [Natrialba aegyptia]ELZ07557.1 hypothetical protein C480_05866 [Natrialba aegyptia DSM 13077]